MMPRCASILAGALADPEKGGRTATSECSVDFRLQGVTRAWRRIPALTRAESAMVKDGQAHLSSLRDQRSIFIEGRRVTDVTSDPSFRNAVHTAAGFYDFQARPENIEAMTFRS